MSRRARLILAVAAMSAIGIVVLAVQLASRGGDDAQPPLSLELRAASAPFAGYRETRIDLDGRCRRVAVADTGTLHEQGLRGRTDLGEYAGMLFVYAGDTDVTFTMTGVTTALEIGWYTPDGNRVGGAHMTPCPDRTQADCPEYRSNRKYRFALETPGGAPAGGELAPCG